MENQNMWYKIFLEYFVQSLYYITDYERVEKMSQKELEEKIIEKRPQISEKQFYYIAGSAATRMAIDSEVGCNAMNDAVCALDEINKFIDLEYVV